MFLRVSTTKKIGATLPTQILSYAPALELALSLSVLLLRHSWVTQIGRYLV